MNNLPVFMLGNELNLMVAKMVSKQASEFVFHQAAEVRMVSGDRGYEAVHARAGEQILRLAGHDEAGDLIIKAIGASNDTNG